MARATKTEKAAFLRLPELLIPEIERPSEVQLKHEAYLAARAECTARLEMLDNKIAALERRFPELARAKP